MARIKNGILDGFSGTVGTVVGSNWRDIDYMRSKPKRRRSGSLTDKQVLAQIKFAVATRFIKTLSGLFEVTFRGKLGVMTGANDALSSVVKNAITGLPPNVNIVYSQVQISWGTMPGTPCASAALKRAVQVSSPTR